MTAPQFTLRNNVIGNPEGKIKFRRLKEGGYEHYHIGLWLEASDPESLRQVERVEYELHPSFRNRVRSSSNRRNQFSITFWSWGTFKVEGRIFLRGQDKPVIVEHDLVYDLPGDSDAYIDVSDL